tara:strand:+ start:870 stop:1289 length:420 start_codon:yes stop_codon:yes gene_type:complete
MNKLVSQIKRHEGIKLKPYLCSEKKITIGYGRNLSDVGISVSEAEEFLRSDILLATKSLLNSFPWMAKLNDARASVCINMTFNLGLRGFKKFVKTISAIESHDFDLAAFEMMDSKWAQQVGESRATELAEQMRTGKWED